MPRVILGLLLVASPGPGHGPAPFVGAAPAARSHGQDSEAQALLARGWARAGNSPSAQRRFASLLLGARFFEEAARTAGSLLAKAPKDALLHGIVGAALTEQKHYARAVPHLETAASLEPRNPQWHALLARARIYLGHTAQAIAAIAKARDLAPEDSFVLQVAAECAYRRMDLGACERFARAILKGHPGDVRALTFLARTLRMTHRHEESRRLLTKALLAGHSHGELHLELGLAWLGLDKPEEAARELLVAARLLPRDPRPHLHLAKVWRRLGKPARARDARTTWHRLRRRGHL